MRAGGVDVLDIFAIALIADRPEAFGHDSLGKAGDGGQRRADLVADLGDEFGLRGDGVQHAPLSIAQFFLDCTLRLLGYPRLTLASGNDKGDCWRSAPGQFEHPPLDWQPAA